MNNHADIVDGVDSYAEERERRDAEESFRRRPTSASFTFGGATFTVADVKNIHIVGNLRPGLQHHKNPFDYEEGYMEVKGQDERAVVVRWANYGEVALLAEADPVTAKHWYSVVGL